MTIPRFLKTYCGAVLLCISASAQAIPATFSVLDPFITVGETFDVEVYAQGELINGDLTAFGFDVDPLGALSLFAFDGYVISPDYFDLGLGDYVSGALDLGVTNAGDNVLLATLEFIAGLTIGTDTLNVQGLFDGLSYGLFYEAADEDLIGAIDITINPNSIPEPSTWLLFGAGVIGLATNRRVRRRLLRT